MQRFSNASSKRSDSKQTAGSRDTRHVPPGLGRRPGFDTYPAVVVLCGWRGGRYRRAPASVP
jgi:hypothetical protein